MAHLKLLDDMLGTTHVPISQPCFYFRERLKFASNKTLAKTMLLDKAKV